MDVMFDLISFEQECCTPYYILLIYDYMVCKYIHIVDNMTNLTNTFH